jgi:hypothetical protein
MFQKISSEVNKITMIFEYFGQVCTGLNSLTLTVCFMVQLKWIQPSFLFAYASGHFPVTSCIRLELENVLYIYIISFEHICRSAQPKGKSMNQKSAMDCYG